MKESYFDGTILQLVGYGILAALLTFFTFGIGYPWALCMLQRWETKHTVIESRRLSFDGTGLQLLGTWIVLALIPFAALFVALILIKLFMNTGVESALGGFLSLLLFIGALLYGFFVRIQIKKWTVKHTHFENTGRDYVPVSVSSPVTPSIPEKKPEPVHKPFPLRSKDLVKADGMVTYCEWFHFESGVPKEIYQKLFEKAESIVYPDKEVVMTFAALLGETPCACVMGATKFIVSAEDELKYIPIVDIDGFTVASGQPMSVITMSHKTGAISFGVDNTTLPLLLNFCNEALADCKKEIEELAAK